MTKTKFEAMDILNKDDIPCGPILSMKEIAEDQSLRATGTVVEVDHPTRGKYITVGNPIKLSDSPARWSARRCSASTPTRSCAACSASAITRSPTSTSPARSSRRRSRPLSKPHHVERDERAAEGAALFASEDRAVAAVTKKWKNNPMHSS